MRAGPQVGPGRFQAGGMAEEAGLRAGPDRGQAGGGPEAAGLVAGPGRALGRGHGGVRDGGGGRRRPAAGEGEGAREEAKKREELTLSPKVWTAKARRGGIDGRVLDTARPWRTAGGRSHGGETTEGGEGRRGCPGGRRAHPERLRTPGVVGRGRWRPGLGEDDDGERRTASEGKTRLARVRSSQQAGDGGEARGRRGGPCSPLRFARGSGDRRRGSMAGSGRRRTQS